MSAGQNGANGRPDLTPLSMSVSGGGGGQGASVAGPVGGVGGVGGYGFLGGIGGPASSIYSPANGWYSQLPGSAAGVNGAPGTGGNGGDGGDAGNGGTGGDAGTNGTVKIAGTSIMLNNVDGTPYTNSSYSGSHHGPPAPGNGGQPGAPGLGGTGGVSSPNLNQTGANGQTGNAGNNGDPGSPSIAGTVTTIFAPPPPLPPTTPHSNPVVVHPPVPTLHLGSSSLLAVPYSDISALDFSSVLASSGALSMIALPANNGSLANTSLASTDDSSLLAGTDDEPLKDVTLYLDDGSTTVGTTDFNDLPAVSDPNVLHGYVSTKVHAAKRQHRGEQAMIIKHLNSGVMLLAPESKTVVETSVGTVTLSPKSIALLIASATQLAIFDLHDDHKGSITVNVGEVRTVMYPGQSLVLNRGQCDSFEVINPIHYVGYRHLISRRLDDSVTAFRGEFHLMSLVCGLEPLRKMVSSPKSDEKHIASRLLRTISLLATMSNSAVPFELKEPPAVAAMVIAKSSR